MRAKMRLISITDYGTEAKELKFNAVTNGSKEDNTFCRFTPSGELRLYVDNPPAIEGMKVGDSFYLDFTKA